MSANADVWTLKAAPHPGGRVERKFRGQARVVWLIWVAAISS